jgi:hypothetical protein
MLMHADRSQTADIPLRQKIANIAIVWREPPLQPNDITYSRVADEPLNFLGALCADREWPFAVHVLAGSDRWRSFKGMTSAANATSRNRDQNREAPERKASRAFLPRIPLRQSASPTNRARPWIKSGRATRAGAST